MINPVYSMPNQKSIMKTHFVIILNMTNWTTFLYALLPHPNQPLILAQNGASGITLPNKVHNERVWPFDTQGLKPILEALTGVPINILRYVARHGDDESSRLYSIHLLE